MDFSERLIRGIELLYGCTESRLLINRHVKESF